MDDLEKSLLEKYPNATFPPEELTNGQYCVIAVIIFTSYFTLCLNLGLLLGKLKVSKTKLSGFDLLLLNQLFINILSTLFVDPWDIIAFSVLQTGRWPFPQGFCYFVRFCATCLPFISSWNIVVIALHQLIAFAFLECYWFNWNFFFSAWVKRLTVLLPVSLLWISGLVIHGPITYHVWQIKFVTGYCGVENLFSLLHDGLGVFVIPAAVGLILLTILFLVKLVNHRAFPSIGNSDHLNDWSVKFQAENSATNGHNFHSGNAESPPWMVDQEFNPYSTDKDDLIATSHPYQTTASTSTVQYPSTAPSLGLTLREITKETVIMACVLYVGLLIFVGPYGVVAMILDYRLRVLEDYDYEFISTYYFAFSKVCFPLTVVRPLFEPVAILCVMVGFRLKELRNLKFKGFHSTAHAGSTWSTHAARMTGNRSDR